MGVRGCAWVHVCVCVCVVNCSVQVRFGPNSDGKTQISLITTKRISTK